MTCNQRNPKRTIKTSATSPAIDAELYSEGSVYSIPDGAAVYFLVYATISGVRTELIRNLATITDQENGLVRYKLTSTDLGLLPGPGEYSAYFELNYGVDPVYYPTPGHIRLVVERL